MKLETRKILILAIMLGAVFLVYRINGNSVLSGESRMIEVTLSSDGFEPENITINRGDTVKFTTTLDKQFWPASNLHPSHTVYPEFDPRRPLEPNETWSFRFDEVGEWRYHDHLFSSHKGTIVVEDKKSKNTAIISDCEENNSNYGCWEKSINEALKNEGIDSAFNVVASIYTDPLFNGNCHDFSHTIGEEAYRLFAQGKDMDISPKTYYCGYGFYHGFMETLLHTTGDTKEAQDFCAYVGKKLYADTIDASGACYHGIGHGAVDGSDPTAWGDVSAMIGPSMDLCRAVADENDTSLGSKFFRCITGVYNGIEILARDPKYKIPKLKEDPFSSCVDEPEGYQQPCYTNMLPALMATEGSDFAKMISIIENIKEKDDEFNIRNIVISDLSHEYIRMVFSRNFDIESGIELCHSLLDPSRKSCVNGLSGGHMKYGEPEKEYIKGLAFCANPLLENDESSICYRHILSRLRIWYSDQESKDICLMVDEEHRVYCAGR